MRAESVPLRALLVRLIVKKKKKSVVRPVRPMAVTVENDGNKLFLSPYLPFRLRSEAMTTLSTRATGYCTTQ